MDKLFSALYDYNFIKTELDMLSFTAGYAIDSDEDIITVRDFLKSFVFFDDNYNNELLKCAHKYGNYNEFYIKAIQFVDSINMIQKKYNVSDMKSLEKLIVSYWDMEHFYSIDVLRVVLGRISESNILSKIYIDMVNENLIENINAPIYSSDEPIFTVLPIVSDCFECNLKLLSRSDVDFSILRNGSAILSDFVRKYNKSTSTQERKYFHDAIMNAIRGNLSLFNDVYYLGYSHRAKVHKSISFDYLGIYSDYSISISDPSFILEIKDYLLSDEGFEHQISLYTDKNERADEVISLLMKERRDGILERKIN